MKKIMSLLTLALLAVSATMAQEKYSETRDVTGFNEVNFSVPGEVYITIGEGYKVVIEGDKEFVSQIETKVSGGALTIKMDKWFNTGNKKVIVDITMPALEGLGISGSGKVVLNNALKSEKLDISVSGSGKVYLVDVDIQKMECNISGSGAVFAEGDGTIGNFEISISGSGHYKGPTTKIGYLDAAISGSGSCDCYVTDKLEAAISGSGNIYYSGNPKIDAAVSGSGHVRSK